MAHKNIEITFSNLTFLTQLLQKLKFPEIEVKLNEFIAPFSIPVDNSPELNDLINFETLVFSITEENSESSLSDLTKFVNKNNTELFANLFFSRCLVTPNDIVFIIDFLTSLNEKIIEKKAKPILPFFKSITLRNLRLKTQKALYSNNSFIQELSFLTIWLIEKQIIFLDEIFPLHSALPPFFAHLMCTRNMHFDLPFHRILCDWDEHKKNILKGDNDTDRIYSILRGNDHASLLQLTQQLHFNYEQIIPPCYYEKFSMLVRPDQKISIIDYCAFFGSLDCFKILANGTGNKLNKNVAIFAAGSGNLELFKLILSPEFNVKYGEFDCLNAAIIYHHQNIIEYLVEVKNVKLHRIVEHYSLDIFQSFFYYSNFSSMVYMIKKGVSPVLFLEAAALCGQSSVIKFLLNYIKTNNVEFNSLKYGINPFHLACLSGNEDTVKHFLQSELFDITEKVISNLCPFNRAKICLIVCFIAFFFS